MDADQIIAIIGGAILLVVLIIIDAKIARNMQEIAADKGYEGKKYWHYCFWLGFIGYAMVIAMPDKVTRDAIRQHDDNVGKLLQQMNRPDAAPEGPRAAAQQDKCVLPRL